MNITITKITKLNDKCCNFFKFYPSHFSLMGGISTILFIFAFKTEKECRIIQL